MRKTWKQQRLELSRRMGMSHQALEVAVSSIAEFAAESLALNGVFDWPHVGTWFAERAGQVWRCDEQGRLRTEPDTINCEFQPHNRFYRSICSHMTISSMHSIGPPLDHNRPNHRPCVRCDKFCDVFIVAENEVYCSWRCAGKKKKQGED